MAGARKLRELATVIRSKAAGPCAMALDVLFPDEATYRRVAASGVFTRAGIAQLYGVPESDVTHLVFYDPGWAIKAAIRRAIVAGDPGDTDVYACQQHVPLLNLEIPGTS